MSTHKTPVAPFEIKVDASRGAPFGRADTGAEQALWRCRPLYLRRVLLDRGGYDPGGAYWGLGDPIWCAFSFAHINVAYIRAPSRNAAKAQFQSTQEGPIKWAR